MAIKKYSVWSTSATTACRDGIARSLSPPVPRDEDYFCRATVTGDRDKGLGPVTKNKHRHSGSMAQCASDRHTVTPVTVTVTGQGT